MSALAPCAEACDIDYKKLDGKIKNKHKVFEETVAQKIMSGLTTRLISSVDTTRVCLGNFSDNDINNMTDVVVEHLLRETLANKASSKFFPSFKPL